MRDHHDRGEYAAGEVSHGRMPVVPPHGDRERWLDREVTDAKDAQPLMRQFDAAAMRLHGTDARYVHCGAESERSIAELAA